MARYVLLAVLAGWVLPGPLAPCDEPTAGAAAAVQSVESDDAVESSESSESSGVELSGRVHTVEGTPVGGATVRARAEDDARGSHRRADVTRSGEDGTFRLAGLTGTVFRLRVEAEGFAPFNAERVPGGASLTVRMRDGFSVTGRVLDQGTDQAMPGATVRACDHEGLVFGEQAWQETVAAEGGRFTLGPLPQGQVWIEAYAAGRARSRMSVALPAEGTGSADEPLALYLAPGGRIAGVVADEASEPVVDATVVLTPRQFRGRDRGRRSALLQAETDERGRFAFDGVAVGTYSLRAHREGRPTATQGPLEVEAGGELRDVVLRMGSGATITVRIIDSDERPVAGLAVELEPSERRGRRRASGARVEPDRVEVGEEGRFTIENLQAGTFHVRLIPEGFADEERRDVRLRDGATTDLGTIVARQGDGVAGAVTDESLQPIAGADVRALWQRDSRFRSREVKTDEQGRYRIPGMDEGGTNQIFVTAKGYSGATRENVELGDRAVDFVLERTGSVTGRVRLSNGEIPPAYEVQAHREVDDDDVSFVGRMRASMFLRRNSQEVFADPTGGFRLDDLDPGTYTIEASATSRAPGRRSGVEIKAAQVVDVGTLELETGLTLRGRVLRAADDTPVPGAAVRAAPPQTLRFTRGAATGRTTVTGSDGLFLLEGLEPGALQVTVEHTEFSRADTRVTLQADIEPPEIVVRLSQGGRLTGTVRGSDGQPVVGARILVTQGGRAGGDPRTVETGPDGRYLLERLPPGAYRVVLTPEDGGRSLADLRMKSAAVTEGETTVVDFDEQPAITLSGRVLRGSEPVGDATLFFLPQAGAGASPPELKAGSSDTTGNYSVGLDHGGLYQVVVQGRGRGAVSNLGSVELNVPEQASVALDIVLRASGIVGVVSDGDGQPVRGALVVARREGATINDPTAGSAAQTDSQGGFSMDGLRPGGYVVSVTAGGFAAAQQSVIVAEDRDSVQVDFRLEHGRTVRGRVVDPQGRGVHGAMVFITPSGAPESAYSMPVQTDINGAFSTSAPAQRSVDVAAVAGGWAPTWLQGVPPPQGGTDGPEIVLQVSAGGWIDVRVLAADGSPVARVNLDARPVGGVPLTAMALAGRGALPTDLDGATRVELLATGLYELRVVGRDDVPPVRVQVQEGTGSAVTFTLP